MSSLTNGSTATMRAAVAYGTVGLLLRALLILFVLSCVFDPADRILQAKVWLFLACCGVALLASIEDGMAATFNKYIVVYTLAFILIPLISIVHYYIADGTQPYEGFSLFKGYILIGLILILTVGRVDLTQGLSTVLALLSLTIVCMAVYLFLYPDLYLDIKRIGDANGMYIFDKRSYGADIVITQVNFVTSPMIVVAIAYYMDAAMTALNRWKMAWYLAIVLLCMSGMILAGTRNNILAAIILPCLIFPMYCRRPILVAATMASIVFGASLVYWEKIASLLSPNEYANSIKLAMISDYIEIFADPRVFWFGSGLGAYHYWPSKGLYFYITELTYLEMIRNFGIFGAAVMGLLLLAPAFIAARYLRNCGAYAITVSYLIYLLMCISNPNLFSSMGILILSVVMVRFSSDIAAKTKIA